MNKTKLLGGLVVVLLILNLFLLFFKPSPRRANPKEVIVEKLELTETQVQKYELSIVTHREAIRALEQKLKKNKTQLYEMLGRDNISSEETGFLMQEISQIHQEIEKVHFAHFQEIKNMCDDSQKENFKALAKEFGKIFSPRKGMPKK